MAAKRLALLISGSSIQAAYVPLMMAATAAAMDYECKLFFAFEGLALLLPEPPFDVPNEMAPAVPAFSVLREACLEQGVELIACSASLSMRGMEPGQLIPQVTLAGMATWLAFASGADIQLNFS
ncbi:MAG: DsrE/DsrF/DrsH-like family protein [Pseudomonadota bacterium]